jgi:hypothetical protein
LSNSGTQSGKLPPGKLASAAHCRVVCVVDVNEQEQPLIT